MGDGVQCLRQEVRYVLQRVDLGHGMMTLHLAFAYDELAPRHVEQSARLRPATRRRELPNPVI